VSPLLHRQAEAGGYRRTRCKVQQAFRSGQVRLWLTKSPAPVVQGFFSRFDGACCFAAADRETPEKIPRAPSPVRGKFPIRSSHLGGLGKTLRSVLRDTRRAKIRSSERKTFLENGSALFKKIVRSARKSGRSAVCYLPQVPFSWQVICLTA